MALRVENYNHADIAAPATLLTSQRPSTATKTLAPLPTLMESSTQVFETVQEVDKSEPPVLAAQPCTSEHRFVKARAAAAYAKLLARGAMRHTAIKAVPSRLRDEIVEQYATKEKFSPWLEEFFHQHMYRLGLDLFNRVIASAPDASVEVVKRVRATPGAVRGNLLQPLYDLELTDETQTCVNLSSYNYLGFGGVDQYCTPAAKAAALEHGFNPAAPRTEGGTLPIHRELEREVATFLQKEDAIVIGMGFATNATILPALLGGTGGNCRGTLVLSDQLNHKSIVEGVRLSGGTVRAFPHNDMVALEESLRSAATEKQPDGNPWRKVFILIEGIYSMEGEFCRLREIVTLKNKYKAYLYLDEAHSIGAVGRTGRGVTELLGVPTSEVEVMMGTFTKSFGSAGGYIASSREVIQALRESAPGSMFATAMSAPCAAQALSAFRVIDGQIGGTTGADKLASIRNNANFFRERLIEEGFTVLGDIDSPVIPVMIFHPLKLAKFSRGCLARGIAVVVVGFPAVPVLEGRARFCVSAAHTKQQLDEVAHQLAAVARDVGILYERSAIRDFVGCGATGRTTTTVEQAQKYASRLRTAPMQRKGLGSVAQEVQNWEPEPLAPAVVQDIQTKLGQIPKAARDAAENCQTHCSTDMRLFDALGFAVRASPGVSDAISQAMAVYGFGACGPRGFYGTSLLHLQLEKCIAQYVGAEDAIMYSAGVATASSVLPALVQPGDHVIVDSEVHLGLRTGLRLCKDAVVTWFSHGNLPELKTALVNAAEKKQVQKKKGSKAKGSARIFVVMEAIYQRTGSMTPLAEVLALKEEYGAYLILDETLSFGTLGAHGRGITEHEGLDAGRVDVLIGSFEHAIAGVGGFCAGRKSVVEHQRLAGAGYCFSASSPPSACAAIMAMLEELSGERGRSRLATLQSRTSLLHSQLREVVEKSGAPLELTSSSGSFVQHVKCTLPLGASSSYLLKVASRCAQSKVFVQLCSPLLGATETSVNTRLGAPSSKMPSLRLCASAEHTPEDIDSVSAALLAALSEEPEADI